MRRIDPFETMTESFNVKNYLDFIKWSLKKYICLYSLRLSLKQSDVNHK